MSVPRQARIAKRFAVQSAFSVAALIVLSAIFLPVSGYLNSIAKIDAQGAKDALGFLKETTTWMAGIQTATIAALGFLAKDGMANLKPTQFQVKLAILVALLNSIALFFSAWILTALPSLMLRLSSASTTDRDFFNLPVYNFLVGGPFEHVFTVHFFAFCNHWLWAFSVLVFGLLCISTAISRSEKEQADTPISVLAQK